MIVDASVAIKWVAPEDGSDLADILLTRGGLIAPDLIAAEIANAVWKKRMRNELSVIPPVLDRIADFFDSLEPTAPLLVRAAELAVDLAHPAYDCFYLALAEATDRKVVSADRKLMSKLAGTPYEARVLSLEVAAS